MIGWPMSHKGLAQAVQDIVWVQFLGHGDCQADSGGRVDCGEHIACAAIVGPVLYEVVGPNMIDPARPQPNAGAVREPETAPLGVLVGDLQPLPSPDPLDPLGIDPPALGPEQWRGPAVAVATVPRRNSGITSMRLSLFSHA